MKQRTVRCLAAVAIAACTPARAQDAPAPSGEAGSAVWSGGIYLASDYIYRGISQSQHHAVWQADLEFGAETGPYAGAFASRVDYTEPGVADDGVNVELSYRVGWRAEMAQGVAIDASLQHVTYPGADAGDLYDYFEASASLSMGQYAALRFMHAPDYFGFDGSVRDYGLDLAWEGESSGVGASVGYFDQSSLAGEGYAYLETLAWRQLGAFRAELGWSRTFSYDEALEEANGASRLARPRLRATLAWEF